MTRPYYRPIHQEVEVFQHAYRNQLALMLKGPTGCGKSRFVEAMAADVGRPLLTVACHDDTSATDLLGRYLVEGGDTVWQDGPLTRAVREGAMLYLDEVTEAREDIVVVLHSLTDHRRQIFVDRRNETLTAPPEFMLVISFNPGYQRSLKELKPSTRQRFVGMSFHYPAPPIEAEIVAHESGVDMAMARRLVTFANKVRHLQELGLAAAASTRLLIHAGQLMRAGMPPRAACHVGVIEPLTDDSETISALQDTAGAHLMSLDEALFTLALRLKRAVWRERVHEAELAYGVRLADIRSHLTLVARALSGAPLGLQEAEHVGGFAGDVLYLPRAMSFAEDPEANALAYLYRVAYTVTSRQLGCVLSAESPQAAALTTLHTLLAVPPTLAALEAELPMTRELRQRFFPRLLHGRPSCLTLHTPGALLEAFTQVLLGRNLEVWRAQEWEHTAGWEWLQGSVTSAQQGHGSAAAGALYASLCRSAAPQDAAPVAPVILWGQLMPMPPRQATQGPGDPGPQASLPTGTEQHGKAKEQVRRVDLSQPDIDHDVLVHTFEKVETAEEFCGVTRTPDGADELARHTAALDELDLRDVVRRHTQTRSLYRADVTLDGTVGDLEAAETSDTTRFLYDEWDGKARQYKKAWCSVYVTRPTRGAASSHGSAYAAAALRKHARHVRDLRTAFDRLRAVRVLKNCQPDGAEVDIDALIERYATVRSGHQPDDKLYVARRRQRRDLVTLLLLDLSSSTDSWIKGHRVLDVAKESLLVLGEVLSSYPDQIGMSGFYSHTRRDCRFIILKDFAEPWLLCKPVLASLEPTGYTRIGPAMRHAIHLLRQQKATQKLLLLISDGKPTDYDRYEGRYGIADVRQAIREAGQVRIHTYALAVDVQAKLYFPEMFGAGNYQILPHPSHLVQSLAQLYTRLSG